MSMTDSRGNPVSTTSRAALDGYERAVDLFHGYFADPLAAIEAALKEDPSFVMGHCFRAALMVGAAEKAAEPALRESVEAAERLAGRANDRERRHVAAARAWLDGDFARATGLYGDILVDYPRDSLALQAAHLGDFYLGHSLMLRDRIARVLPAWDESVPGFGYVLGMHAFGLEEMGDYSRAEATGRRALELNRRDPWAVHAVAHVMEMQGRLADGIRWLEGRREDWAPENMFSFHNWWHLALYYLDLAQSDRVLALYDGQVRPQPSQVALEMVDASALLWRLHLRGVDVGDRWARLADSWEAFAEDGYYAFNDVHAMMAFVGAGYPHSARRLMAAMERAAQGRGTNAMMTREVGLPFCRAIMAFADGRYGECVELLAPVRPVASRFGGSHAQRDIVHLTLLEAAFRAGNGNLARALAAERIDLKPTSPFNWTAAARAQEALGDADGARVSLARAVAMAA